MRFCRLRKTIAPEHKNCSYRSSNKGIYQKFKNSMGRIHRPTPNVNSDSKNTSLCLM